jgi:hypothetical protein
MSAESPSNISTNPSEVISEVSEQLLKFFKKKQPTNRPPGGQGVGVQIFLPRILFLLVRSPYKNLKPYDNPFWEFRNGGERKEKKINYLK